MIIFIFNYASVLKKILFLIYNSSFWECLRLEYIFAWNCEKYIVTHVFVWYAADYLNTSSDENSLSINETALSINETTLSIIETAQTFWIFEICYCCNFWNIWNFLSIRKMSISWRYILTGNLNWI